MKKLIAPCGIDCAQCDAYIATQTNDTTIKQQMAENFLKQFGKEIDLADLDCDGCPSEGKHIGFCAQCEIRACSFGKGLSTCAECGDFPCSKGEFIWKNNSQSKATLEAIRNQ